MTGRKLYILRAAGLLLAWALLLLLVFLARVWQGERKLREPGAYLSGLAEPLPDPQWVSWNGKPYEYREGLINILFLGIDGRGKAEESTAIGFGAKADCIILATLDTKEHTLAFLNISRDSVTPCRWFDSTGKEIGLYDYQLGLQYTMGDGLETSCEYMEEAVSRMLGGSVDDGGVNRVTPRSIAGGAGGCTVLSGDNCGLGRCACAESQCRHLESRLACTERTVGGNGCGFGITGRCSLAFGNRTGGSLYFVQCRGDSQSRTHSSRRLQKTATAETFFLVQVFHIAF